MKTISFFCVSPDPATGFGAAGASIVDTLTKAGYRVIWNDPDNADIQLNWCHPLYATMSKDIPNIIYFPWESSEPHPGWKNVLRRAESICVTSYQLQNWVREWGFDSVLVPHGIDDIWKPEPRLTHPFTFLDVSQPRRRVNSQLTYDAFKAAFGDDENFRLVMKAKGQTIVKYHKGSSNVKTITETLPISELVGLYLNSHSLVHLSFAEGFSLAPFQMIATGGLTITPAETVPYRDYLIPSTNLYYDDYVESDMFEHPGKILRSATLDEVVAAMRTTVLDYESLAQDATLAGKALREDYQWSEVIKPLVAEIERLT